jgi:hypothetical protein
VCALHAGALEVFGPDEFDGMFILQCVMTDRGTAMIAHSSLMNLIENLVFKIPELIHRHYATIKQARYLKF